jgi:DNA-binding NarL/FixJ family response regulator
MSQRIRVLIADDHAQSRKGLRALLSTCPTIEVVSEAENGREAARQVKECQPDVVIMDIRMPVWDGLEATRYIKARWPEVSVIALTIRASWRAEAMSAGADGFFLKGCSSAELLAAVQRGNTKHSKPPRAKSEAPARKDVKHRPNRLSAAVLTG